MTDLVLGRSHPARSPSFTAIAVTIAYGALLLPIWVPPFVPTLDGPIHLDIVRILHRLAANDAPIAHFFTSVWSPEPNLSIYALLLGLTQLVPPLLAEKLLLSFYVLSMTLAAPIFVRIAYRAWPRNALIWLATVPFAFSAPFWFGFYNFVLSLPLFVIALALSLRFLQRPNLRIGIALGLTALATIVTHVMSYAALGVAIAALLPWTIWSLDRPRTIRHWIAALARRTALTLPVFLPSLLLLGLFLWRNQTQEMMYNNHGEALADRVRELGTLSSMFASGLIEALLVAGLLLLLLVAALPTLLHARKLPVDGLPVAAMVMAAIALAVPDRLFGGGYTAIRIQLYPYLLCTLWLAARLPQLWVDRRQVALGTVAIALTLLLAYVDAVVARRMGLQVAHVVDSLHDLPRGTSIVPIVFEPNGHDTTTGARLARGVPFLLNVASRVAAAHDGINLRMHQANTLNFPIRYRTELNPYVHLPVINDQLWKDSIKPSDLAQFGAQLDRYPAADAVLVIGLDPARPDARLDAVRMQLGEGWRETHASSTAPGLLLFQRASKEIRPAK